VELRVRFRDFGERRGRLGRHSLRIHIVTLVLGRRGTEIGIVRRGVGGRRTTWMGRNVDVMMAERGKW